MPGQISIKVRGIKTTRKKFKQLRDSVRQNSIDALDRIVKRIEADAKRLEDPKKGLKHQSRRSLRGKPTPYLVPALEKNFNRINSEIAKGVKTAVRRVGS